jgi:carbamoyltransferase
MLVLGVNMHHPDASVALIDGGKVVWALAEERLSRKKHQAGVPKLALRACFDSCGVSIRDIDHVAVGRDPAANRVPRLRYSLAHARQLPQFVELARRRLKIANPKAAIAAALEVDEASLKFQVHPVEHHVAHLATSFYTSGWERAAGLSYDGSGDFVTTMLAECTDKDIRVLRRTFVPESLGYFYTMVCEFIGYRKYGDEGKVMGLAPYGTRELVDRVGKIISTTLEGYALDQRYFSPFGTHLDVTTDEITRKRFATEAMRAEFGDPREPYSEYIQRDKDLAFAVQHHFERIALHLTELLYRQVPVHRLVMAGGAALNSVANGKIVRETPFTETSLHPACGDDGLAVGAALYVWHKVLGMPRREGALRTAALGNEYSEEEIRRALDARGVVYTRLERDPLLDVVADEIAAGNVIGWFQGRMEWGPRALGNRSIVAHPGLPDMKDKLNARIKHREWFRPFAPSVLADRQSEIFDSSHPSPYMLHVFEIRPEWRDRLCAVNHIDNTGRLQSVARDENPLYYDLIERFGRKTGIPVVLNTSFNENEPIVCHPSEAIDCFMRTKMDMLAIGPFIARKQDQVAVPEPVQG